MGTRIGIDLGGTKIELVVLDADGRERWRRRVPTPQGDYGGTLRAIAALVEEAERLTGAGARIGVGTPGSPSPRDGRIRNANSTCLNGQPLQQDLEALLRRPLRLANDANCLAMSEAADGVHVPCSQPSSAPGWAAASSSTRNCWSAPTRWPANGATTRCRCPRPTTSPCPPAIADAPAVSRRAGCIETYLSGPGLAADHLRHGGEPLDAAAIARQATEGRRASQASLERYELRLARALAGVINLLDPEVIVLGGGLSQIARLYEHVPRRWAAHVFSDTVSTRLLPARHGDASGVRGAAWLWPSN